MSLGNLILINNCITSFLKAVREQKQFHYEYCTCINYHALSETVNSYCSEHHTGGRAIAQAVSRRLPTAAARVQTRVWSCEIL
jgi:hypothetical protein